MFVQGFSDPAVQKGPAVLGKIGVELRREDIVVIATVHHDGETLLLDVAQGGGLLRGGLRLGEDGEEDGGEDRDDRDHDEELDEGECLFHGGTSAVRRRRDGLIASVGDRSAT